MAFKEKEKLWRLAHEWLDAARKDWLEHGGAGWAVHSYEAVPELESKITDLEKTVELLTDRYSQNRPETVEEALTAADTTWADGTWAKQCARILAAEVRRLRESG